MKTTYGSSPRASSWPRSTNKGFVIGLLVMPAIFAVAVHGDAAADEHAGRRRSAARCAVIDPTGQILDGLRAALTPGGDHAAPARERAARALENAPAPVRAVAGDPPNAAIERAMGAPPAFTLVERPRRPTCSSEKHWLTEAPAARTVHVIWRSWSFTRCRRAGRRRRTDYGTYDLYVPENTDERVETTIYDGLRETLVDARACVRSNMDRAQVEAVMRVPAATSVTVDRRRRAPDQRRLQPHRCRSSSPACWCSGS